MNFDRRRFLATVSTAGLAGPAFAQARPVRMALDWALEGQQSPFILAADDGHFRRAGIEVRVDRGYGSGDTVTKIASGAYDIGFADLGAAIAFNAHQGALKIINVFQLYDLAPLAIMTLKSSGINRPADLVGKVIAAPPGDSSRVMFPVLARTNGFDPGAVTWLDVSPQLREAMLAQKRAQAISAQVTSLLSFRPLGLQDQIGVMRYGDHKVDLYGHAVLTTPDFARDNPDVLRRVLLGVASAWRTAVADPARSAAALVKRDALTDGALERERLGLILDAAVITPHVRSHGLSQVVPERMARTITSVGEGFGLTPVGIQEMYRPDFLPGSESLRLAG